MNNKTHKLFAAISFLVSLVVYFKTMAPTVSFWDCGEFIACSYKLLVPHPPGAPLYLLVGRVFSLIPEFLIENVAKRMNLISVLSSAFTVLFLHLIIVHVIKEYLKSNEGFLKYVPHLGALIGALCFAFSYSFWFNAVEAEVYAPSMLFTGLCVWLVFHWSEKSQQIGNEKYILLIFYLIGLAIGVHLLNILTLPMIILIIYFKKFKPDTASFSLYGIIAVVVTFLIYPGMVKGLPLIADKVGFFGLTVFILIIVALLGSAISNRQHIYSLMLLCTLLIIVGYSSYLTIYIRSGLNPSIDENNPETVEEFIKYVNRKQYGDHHFNRARKWKESPNGKNYNSALSFFWDYQINEMYTRYFFWNFAGIEESGNFNKERKRANLFQFWLGPLLLGVFGMLYHFTKDWKRALAILLLFFATGLAIILYLNQPDPQPRERDYSYVGSFFAFAIWIGIGAAALLEWAAVELQNRKGSAITNTVCWLLALIILFWAPARMLAVNYHSHDRTGNYVAWDYSYNMLVSAEEGGVMFTNGDNDTFPLWYLQEVENIRTDVRVANLSLLNTTWYIDQLKNTNPKVPISLSDADIAGLDKPENMPRWPKARTINISTIAPDVKRYEEKRYRLSLTQDNVDIPDKISFNLKPKLYMPYGSQKIGLLRIQDWLVLNILVANEFKKPLYFAVTSSDQNRLDGLKKYQRMDGLLFRITTVPNWQIDPDVLYDNLMNKFRYTNLDNPDVYLNENITGLLQNYRSAFFRLCNYYLSHKNKDRFKEVIQKAYKVMPPEVIPFTNNQFEEVMTALAVMGDVYPRDSLNTDKYSLRILQACGEVGLNYKDYDLAIKGFTKVLEALKAEPNGNLALDYFKGLFGKNYTRFLAADSLQKAAAIDNSLVQLQRQLVKAYKKSQDYAGGIAALEQWKKERPNDKYISKQLEEFVKLQKKQD